MKKKAFNIVLLIITACILFSCSGSKSLQELLQEERKSIDRFITMNDLVILSAYPKDGVFKEKEYFRTADGLFFHVVDSGNGTRAQLLNDISVRFDYSQNIKSVVQGDSSFLIPYYYGDYYLSNPFSFVYGISQTYSSTYTPVCQAWVVPLSYVGEGAVLDMIIPSSMGAYIDSQYPNINPVFYKNLRYTRFN